MENKALHTVIGIATNVCRFILAIVFIISGFVKAIDPLGTHYKIGDYAEAFNLAAWVPQGVSLLLAVALGMVEFFLGVFLFFGIHRRRTCWYLLWFMLIVTPLTLWLAVANPISDCGCFGDAIHLTNWQTFAKNLVLLALVLCVRKWSMRIIPLVTWRFDWLIEIYSFLYIVGISVYCYRYLPVFDFRPYYIGADIKQGMTIPEGETPTEYETTFICKKGTEEKEFTLDNYPDSTWTLVDTRLIVKKEGYEPPIHDFFVNRWSDGEDITSQLLDNPGYTFLLVAHQLAIADDSTIDLINEVYDYSKRNGYNFYALTSSPDEDIESWQERTGAEYPFCLMDDITLKTMIRSNPGFMLLKGGVVINKWSVNDIPDEYELTDRLENLPLAQVGASSLSHRLFSVISWFVFPLALFCLFDVAWKKIQRRRQLRKNEN